MSTAIIKTYKIKKKSLDQYFMLFIYICWDYDKNPKYKYQRFRNIYNMFQLNLFGQHPESRYYTFIQSFALFIALQF